MHPDTNRRLRTYRPAVLDRVDRDQFEAFARAVFAFLPDLAYKSEMYRAWAIAIAAAWATETGVGLRPDIVFHPDNIERCADWWKARGRDDGELRWALRTISRSVVPDLSPAAPTARNKRTVSAPYTPDEIRRLERDADAQRTPTRERHAKTILLAGLACGLRPRFLTTLRARDVVARHGVTGIVVAETSVFVPALDQWARPLADYAARFDPNQTLLSDRPPTPNQLGHCCETIETSPRTPRFAPTRFRSTWLVAHIAAGTRLPDLLAAAHLETLTQINQLLAYAPHLDPAAAAHLLAHIPHRRPQ